MSVTYKPVTLNKLNCTCLRHIINILLTELSRSVWENLDLGRAYRPHCVRSVLTTSVKILPYRPPARLIRAKYQFIIKGVRGGISYIASRHGQANNKYMSNYDKNKPSKFITYLDANNLYGWARSQYLPTGGFRWMTEKEINKTNLAKYKDDSKKGLMLEVDLEYKQKLHDQHNHYPKSK